MSERTREQQLSAELRLARHHAHTTDAERAEMEARLHTALADAARAHARSARTHAEGAATSAALHEVRRLCDLTISSSVRVEAINQAKDTVAVIDSVLGRDVLPGDAAWGSVWLHGNWQWLTTNMTKAERELAADAVARWSASLAEADGEEDRTEPDGLRWWREAGR